MLLKSNPQVLAGDSPLLMIKNNDWEIVSEKMDRNENAANTNLMA